MTQFGEPSTGSLVKPAELISHLIVVRPTGYKTEVNTSLGVKDAVEVDIDDIETGESYEGGLLFNGALIGAFKGAIGTQLLGRIVLGQAKPGQSPPYLFESATSVAADVSRASDFLTAKVSGSFSPPATAVSEPVAQPTPEQIAAFLAQQAAQQTQPA